MTITKGLAARLKSCPDTSCGNEFFQQPLKPCLIRTAGLCNDLPTQDTSAGCLKFDFMMLNSQSSLDQDRANCTNRSGQRNRIRAVAPLFSSTCQRTSLLPRSLSSAARSRPAGCWKRSKQGFTVIELIVAMTILMILTAAAVPVVRVTIQRNQERDLRRSLWEMRDAIDRYKDAADRGAFQIKVDSQGYPPDLETLVKGVDSNGKKLRFLRRIPVDPMTGKTEWGLRSVQDEPDSDSWGGQNIFDVYTKSEGTALDGTKYKTW